MVGNFTGAAATCKACAKGSDRVCAGCTLLKPASAFSDGAKRSCRDCNKHKDTADHVETCCTPGCEVAFARNPDTFTWRSRSSGGNWNSTCRRCCAPRPKEEPGQCSRCGELKQLVHGLQCSDCVNERHKRAREEACSTADPSSTPGKACTRDGCGRSFSPEEFRWQGDRWSSWCNECFNGAQYHATYRSRRFAEDPDGFRAHNNAVLRSWKERHPSNVASYYATAKAAVDPAWERFKRSALNNGKSIDNAQEEDLKALTLQPCFYCGYLPAPGDPLNSLDRVDNTLRRYTVDNVVTSCFPCNWLKGDLTLEDFRRAVQKETAEPSHEDAIPRREVVAAWRSLANHDPARRATVLPRQQQMHHIAKHWVYD